MTVVAFLSVAPVVEGSMASEVAKAVAALDDFDVTYETTPMGTTIEADDVGTVFAAAQAAHEAVDGDRVSTFLKIDDKRTKTSTAADKVRAVEEHLGRAARSGSGAVRNESEAAGNGSEE
ncbi:MTH1187 family thiamine-binding protein [Haloarchaeobius sp. TZWWS8]|uniref:MTH1187 family thiamine-binding protein n=1 Tax=Haloarchaeobius sp. TZWWS8 TaxID=3446121 RepID=UPI003EBF1B1E